MPWRAQEALYRSLIDAVRTLAGNVLDLVQELYGTTDDEKYPELIQGIADIALTIVDAVPPKTESPPDLQVMTELLRETTLRLRKQCAGAIQEVQKLLDNGCSIVALSHGARTLCDTCKHVVGISTIILSGPVPISLQEFLDLMASMRSAAEAVMASSGKQGERLHKKLLNLQELAVSSYGDLPTFRVENETPPASKEEFSQKLADIEQYLALLMRQLGGKKSSAAVAEFTRNTKEIFVKEWLDCCLFGARRCSKYRLSIDAKTEEESAKDSKNSTPKGTIEEMKEEKRKTRKKSRSRETSPSRRRKARRPLPSTLPSRTRSPSLTNTLDTTGTKAEVSSDKQEFSAIRERKRRNGTDTQLKEETVFKRQAVGETKKPSTGGLSLSKSSDKSTASDAVKESSDGGSRRLASRSTSERLGQKSLNSSELEELALCLSDAISSKKTKSKKKKKEKTSGSDLSAPLTTRDNDISRTDTDMMASVHELLKEVPKSPFGEAQNSEKEADGNRKKRLHASFRSANSSRPKLKGERPLSPVTSPQSSPTHSPKRDERLPDGPVRIQASDNVTDTSALVGAIVKIFREELPWFADHWILADASGNRSEMTSESDSPTESEEHILATISKSNSPTEPEEHPTPIPDSIRNPKERAGSCPAVQALQTEDTVARSASLPCGSTDPKTVPSEVDSLLKIQTLTVNKIKILIATELASRQPQARRYEPARENSETSSKPTRKNVSITQILSNTAWVRNSNSATNILGPLEVPRLRQVASPLAASADSLVSNLLKQVEEQLEASVIESSCEEFYEHLSRITHLCSEGPGKQEALQFLDGPSLRERLTAAPLSGKVDESLSDVTEASNKSRLLYGQFRASLYREISSFRALIVQCCSTINSIEPGADRLRGGVVLQIVTHVVNFLTAVEKLLTLAESTCYLRDMVSIHEATSSFTPRCSESDTKASNVWMERALPAELQERYVGIELGTVNSLVNSLTSFTHLDEELKLTFVATYPSFMTSEEFFDKLMERFEVPMPFADSKLPVQLRVCVVIKSWMSAQFLTFSDSLIQKLSYFIDGRLKTDNLEQMSAMLSATLASLLNKREEIRKCFYGQARPALQTITLFDVGATSPADVLVKTDPKKLALHLCYHDFAIFKNIQTEELLNQAWTKGLGSPSVTALIQRSNHVSYWVASVILWQQSLNSRVRVVERLIDLLDCVVQLNNFTAFMAIYGGMNMASCSRLKLTFSGIHANSAKKLEKLQEIADPTKSFTRYRKELRNAVVPAIPYLGTHLMDLTFVDEGNTDFVEGYINIGKFRMMYQVIQEISMYQQQGYAGEPEEPLFTFTMDLPHLDEESLWNLSLEREPRKPIL